MGKKGVGHRALKSPTAEHAAAARLGDPAAMEALCRRIQARLYRFSLLLTGNPESAKDLSQEAYMRVIEHLGTLQDPNVFVGWLYQITRNCFLGRVRRLKNQPHVDIAKLGEALFSYAPKPEVAIQIEQLFTKATPQDRLLVLLVYLEGHSYAEAAIVTGLSEPAVKARLFRLRRLFRADFLTDATKI